MKRTAIPSLAIAAAAALFFAACSTQTKVIPSTKAPASSPTVTGIGATPEVAPPAVPGGPGAEGTAAPSQEPKLQAYQGQVKKTWVEGQTQFEGIVSDYPCKAASDCTSTKYYNVPRKDDDCTCAAPCTPYVVSKAEKERREEANKKHCDVDDWYGVECPAPDCSFIEFDAFRCYQGKCAGLALGRAM